MRRASTNSSSGSPTRVSKPALRPVACHRCRERRSFCSKDQPKCTRCQAGNFDCVYETARKITINEAYLRGLEAKVRLYEDTYPHLKVAAARLATRRTAQANDDDDDEHDPEYDDESNDEVQLPEAFNQLSVSSPQNTPLGFKGPAHSDHILRLFGRASRLPVNDESLDQHAEFYDRNSLPVRRLSTHGHVRLPPIAVCRQLFAAQYTYIGTIFAFTDHDAFEQLLQEAYVGPPDLSDGESCLAHAKLLAILAFGKMYSVNQWIDYNGPPGFEYFTHALSLLPDMHEQGSILFVETLALIGYFMQNLNRIDAAFLYVGMALRMAITLGLHQEATYHPGPLPAAEKERRRRVWWSVYSLDRIQSVKSGNPLTIHDHDIRVALPSAPVLRHYTQLSQICGTITACIYRRSADGRPKSASTLMASVETITTALARWHHALPPQLRVVDPARLCISRESVSMLLHYSQCINMTARPLLFHVVQKCLKSGQRDWKAGLTQTTVRVIEMCVAAARDTISMMTIAAQKNLVATYGYMDSEHAFSAATVLVMVCVAFPGNEANTQSMEAGLELLRGMALRGNNHMAARHELLDRLRSTLLPDDDAAAAAVAVTPMDVPSQQTTSTLPSPSTERRSSSTAAPPSIQQQQQQQQSPFFPSYSDGGPVLSHDDIHPTMHAAATASSSSSSSIFPPIPQQQQQQIPEFPFLTNPRFGEGLFTTMHNDLGAAAGGGSAVTNNNQDFWEEAFANPAGDPGNTLMESLEWTTTQMGQPFLVHREEEEEGEGPLI